MWTLGGSGNGSGKCSPGLDARFLDLAHFRHSGSEPMGGGTFSLSLSLLSLYPLGGKKRYKEEGGTTGVRHSNEDNR